MSEGLFYAAMNNKSNEELIDIITNQRDSYRPEAIQDAEEALKMRNINDEEVNRLTEKAQAAQIEIESQEKIKSRGLFNGPGIVVTIFIIAALMAVIRDRGTVETIVIAAVGFGAGHGVNHLYFKRKK